MKANKGADGSGARRAERYAFKATIGQTSGGPEGIVSDRPCRKGSVFDALMRRRAGAPEGRDRQSMLRSNRESYESYVISPVRRKHAKASVKAATNPRLTRLPPNMRGLLRIACTRRLRIGSVMGSA